MRDMSTPRQPKRTASIPLDTDHHTCSYATARSSTNTIAHRHPAVFKDMSQATLLGLPSAKGHCSNKLETDMRSQSSPRRSVDRSQLDSC
jgi:hypothetical protein